MLCKERSPDQPAECKMLTGYSVSVWKIHRCHLLAEAAWSFIQQLTNSLPRTPISTSCKVALREPNARGGPSAVLTGLTRLGAPSGKSLPLLPRQSAIVYAAGYRTVVEPGLLDRHADHLDTVEVARPHSEFFGKS
jgi:hypothetical protein